MNISELCIRRPVFATVLSLLLVLFGLVALQRLAVREYPDINRPVVSITTIYRGASAAVVENKITQAIEDRIAGIEGILKLESDSEDERSSIRIEFDVERDIDAAANDVRDRISRVIVAAAARGRTAAGLEGGCDRRSRDVPQLQLREDDGARGHGLRRALHRRPALDDPGRRARGAVGRPARGDADLDRPAGAGGARADGRATSRTRCGARTCSCRRAASSRRRASSRCAPRSASTPRRTSATS